MSKRSGVNAGYLAWTAMFCSIFIWGIGEVQPGTLGNTGNWYRIILVLFAAIAGVFALLRNVHRLSQAFSGPLLLLLGYGLIAMISSLFIPAYSFYSMWKGFEVAVDVIAIAAVMSYPQPQDSARTAYSIILILFGLLLVVYLVEALVTPSSALLPSRGFIPFTLQGVLPVMNGNSLAFLSAVVAFGVWCRLFRPGKTRGKLLLFLVLALALVALILAQSRTSLIGLIIAVCVYLFFDRRLGLFTLIASASLIIMTFTQLSNVAEQYVVRGQGRELFTTLSGRTQAWEAAWASFQQSPLVGHGFAAAARAGILGTSGASTLHGAIFDVMVGVGLMGFIPWVATILWTSLRLLRLTHRRSSWLYSRLGRSMRAEMLGVLALILVRSSTSSGLAMHEHTFMLFLVVLAYASTTLRIVGQGVAVDDDGVQLVELNNNSSQYA